MLQVMDKLEIDDGIRAVIRQLWKHCYKTVESCEGDNSDGTAYVTFKKGSGDGWFEKNSSKFGLQLLPNIFCCDETVKRYNDYNYCKECGAGINGNVVYRGR